MYNSMNISKENIQIDKWDLDPYKPIDQSLNKTLYWLNNYNSGIYEIPKPLKKPKRSLSKTFTSTFKLWYSEEEQKEAAQFDRKLSWKVNIETKHPKESVIGISKVGYLKDPVIHKRGRSSEQSNKNTFKSQVRYLPGSIEDTVDIEPHTSWIKLGSFKRIFNYFRC